MGLFRKKKKDRYAEEYSAVGSKLDQIRFLPEDESPSSEVKTAVPAPTEWPADEAEEPGTPSEADTRLGKLIGIIDEMNEEVEDARDNADTAYHRVTELEGKFKDLHERVQAYEGDVDDVVLNMDRLKAKYEPKDFRGLLQNSPKWIQVLYFPARTALAVSIAGIILSYSGGHASESLGWQSLREVAYAAGAMFLGTAVSMALLSWLTRPRKIRS